MDKLYTVSEVSEQLRLSVQTVRRHIKENKLKAIKICGGWRIKQSDLDDYVNGGGNE